MTTKKISNRDIVKLILFGMLANFVGGSIISMGGVTVGSFIIFIGGLTALTFQIYGWVRLWKSEV